MQYFDILDRHQSRSYEICKYNDSNIFNFIAGERKLGGLAFYDGSLTFLLIYSSVIDASDLLIQDEIGRTGSEAETNGHARATNFVRCKASNETIMSSVAKLLS